MKLFLDQMIDSIVAQKLRSEGYAVECAFEKDMSRADDFEIIKYCISAGRILVTLDEHFGDWTLIKLSHHPGVIRLKVNPANSATINEVLLPFLKRNSSRDYTDILAIVKNDSIRWIKTS